MPLCFDYSQKQSSHFRSVRLRFLDGHHVQFLARGECIFASRRYCWATPRCLCLSTGTVQFVPDRKAYAMWRMDRQFVLCDLMEGSCSFGRFEGVQNSSSCC